MSQWVAVARVEECPPGSSLERIAGDHVVALFNVDGTFHALDGVCPHQGGPLGKGMMSGCVVTCPWHAWRFRLADGAWADSPRVKIDCYPVRVEQGVIMLQSKCETTNQ